jgi:MFS family permease
MHPIWLQQTQARERRALVAACGGFGLDGFDTMSYSFVIPSLSLLWGLTRTQAGDIATAALLTSAIGGWVAGLVADRHGRVLALQLTVAWFAAFTFLSGFAHSPLQLLAARALQGFGFGGEWAVGSLLIAETVAPRLRGRAAGLVQSSWAVGWALAAASFWGLSAHLPARFAWRALFWLGILPALLIIYVRRRVTEPEAFTAARRGMPLRARIGGIFDAALWRTTLGASLLAAGMQGGYYSLSTWLPTYLRAERHMDVGAMTGYLLILIAGSFAGYLTSAWLNDAVGRRRTCSGFALGATLAMLAFMGVHGGDALALACGFAVGFFTSGIFAGMGAFLAELFPTALRGSGQGFSYNAGRALGAVCPAAIGRLSPRFGLAESLVMTAACAYGLVILCAALLPETRGRDLAAPLSARA